MIITKLHYLLILQFFLFIGLAAGQTQFEAVLSGSNEVPPITSTGWGKVMAEMSGDTLKVWGDFGDLTSDFNTEIAGGSHLHASYAGENGGVELALTPTLDGDLRGGTFEKNNNTFVLTTEQKTYLMTRQLYVNIHTIDHPAGEIRGQLGPAADMHFRANLAGSNEVPPVFTQANGAIFLELHGDSLVLSGTFQNLDSDYNTDIAGGAHIHMAYAGRNGGVELPLEVTLDGDGRGGVYKAIDNKFGLTAGQKAALMERRLYVNIHTVEHPPGAIRGQIVPQTARALFRAALSGTQEIPPIMSEGNGGFLLELYGDSLKLSGAFQDLDSDMNVDLAGGSHLHMAMAGSNGAVTIPLVVTLADNKRDGVYRVMDNTFELTEEQKLALMERRLYANIHSLDDPAGEIRGQVVPEGYAFLTAYLAGENEVPPIKAGAFGGVIAEYTGEKLVLTGSFNNLSSALNTGLAGGAHIHIAPPNENGGIEIGLHPTVANGDTSGMFKAMDNQFTLTENQKTKLSGEDMYVNVHTINYSPGEVRGQLLPQTNRFPEQTMITQPADGQMITIEGKGWNTLTVEWNETTDPDGNQVNYIYQISEDSLVDCPLITKLVSLDSTVTIDYELIENWLVMSGVEVGESKTFYHRVNTSDGSVQKSGKISMFTVNRGMVEKQPDKFVAMLSGSNEVPPVMSTGWGNVMAQLSGDSLKVWGDFGDLTSDFNIEIEGGAHLHVGLAGENGGIEIRLTPTLNADKRGGMFEKSDNTFVLTAEQKNWLMQRKLYVNIHTVDHPAGEVRGQLAPAAEMYFRANLSGSNEAPPVFTQAHGALFLELHGDTLVASGTFRDLNSDYNTAIAGGAHIHMAYTGRNGGVEIPLEVALDVDKRSGSYKAEENSFILSAEQKTALMERKLYVNIHSVDNPAGAIRGQIVPQKALALFRAALSGSHVVPSPVMSDGSGAFLLELYSDTLKLSGAFQNLTSNMNVDLAGGSHLHMAPAGSNGGVAIPLNVTLDNNNRDAVYKIMNNTFELTEEQKLALMERRLYANIHSMNYPAGEIRGQVVPEGYAFLTAFLAGKNEVPPIQTPAYGGVIAEYTGEKFVLTGSFNGLGSAINTDLAGGAHIHVAPLNQNGGIEIALHPTVAEGDTSGRFEAMENQYTLTDEQKAALTSENMYVNVHSMTFPPGEVRGQLLPQVNHFPEKTMITQPADGQEITVEGDGSSMFQVNWTKADDPDGNKVAYIWQLSADTSFQSPILNTIVGMDSMFTTNFMTVDSILAAAGVESGESITLYHRAQSTDGSLQAMGEYSSVVLTRGTLTLVDGNSQAIPEQFTLNGNYPNPFNPSTTISFDLPEESKVRLFVYDVLGREVYSLDYGKMDKGFEQEIRFDAENLTTGVYFYKLIITSKENTITDIGKMMLMR